jgi:hypothetical protein
LLQLLLIHAALGLPHLARNCIPVADLALIPKGVYFLCRLFSVTQKSVGNKTMSFSNKYNENRKNRNFPDVRCPGGTNAPVVWFTNERITGTHIAPSVPWLLQW